MSRVIKIRCKWCNLDNSLYVKYHDEEWGQLNLDDNYLFEMLLLESFQAGLSWECVLNKREAFRKAYDNFDLDKICSYSTDKIDELLNNKDIIRNKLKIKASISNARIFKDLKKRGMKFVGSVIIYSYLQAIGIIYSHDKECFLYKKK